MGKIAGNDRRYPSQIQGYLDSCYHESMHHAPFHSTGVQSLWICRLQKIRSDIGKKILPLSRELDLRLRWKTWAIRTAGKRLERNEAV